MNELRGKEFGGELEQLRQAARVNLPRLADEYATAMTAVSDTSTASVMAFSRDEYFGGHMGPAYDSWKQLRQILECALGESGANIASVAQVLDWALDDFIEADGEAADAMRDAQSNFEDENGPEKEEWNGDYEDPFVPVWPGIEVEE